jgi:MarR family transcriptional regulator, transcriptional regulator for hemolysin
MSTGVTVEALPPQPLASDLCWLLGRASQLLSAEFSKALTDSGISPRQHSVLITALGDELTQTELARRVGLDKTTMMVTLDELEKAGLAERRPRPGDRRARVVAVTDEGRRAVDAAEAILADVRDRVLGLLPAEQRDAFLQSLGCLACAENIGLACSAERD